MGNPRTGRTTGALVALALLVSMAGCGVVGAPNGAVPAALAFDAPGTAPSAAVPAPSGTATPPAGTPVPAPLPSLDASDVALQSAMPGLYGAAELHPTVSGDTVSVWSQGSCENLLDVLRAGQWTIDLFHQPTRKGQDAWAAVMRKGDARALLVLNGGENGCDGRIVHDQVVQVDASGAVSAHGQGRYLSILCQQNLDLDSTSAPSSASLFALYSIGRRTVLVAGVVPASKGSTHVTAAQLASNEDSDNQTPGLGVDILHGADPVETALTAYGFMLYPMDLTQQEVDKASGAAFGAMTGYGSGPKTSETITITGTSPLTGTFSATALADEQHPTKTLDFSGAFTCSL